MNGSPSGRYGEIAGQLRASGSVFAEDEAVLLVQATQDPAELAGLVARRTAGEPLEHVLGWVDFCGLRIRLDPGVFVPRGRTQLLAQQAFGLIAANPCVAELCCGCGAISAVLLDRLSRSGRPIELCAVDIDPAAVRCARRNLPAGMVFEGDLYQALPGSVARRLDLVIANAPYVPTSALDLMPREARLHEPRIALDGGPDGLDVLRRVIAGAPDWLRPGGSVIVQGSEQQAAVLAETLAGYNFSPRTVIDRELDDATVVIGAWNG